MEIQENGKISAHLFGQKELLQSVSEFLRIRGSEGSPEDLVSIINFSSEASIEVANSPIHPKLINELKAFGSSTNFSPALKAVIKIIKEKRNR